MGEKTTKKGRSARVLVARTLVARTLVIGAIIIGALGIGFLTGPRVSTEMPVERIEVAENGALDSLLAASEAAAEPPVWPGAEKEIVWARSVSDEDASVGRTPLSIVYVHGFSATKQEIRPVPDMVARELGANLFFTRLTGHGQGAASAMGRATLADWARDAAQAVGIGEAIGERVVLMGTSTGGTLVTWLATQPELAEHVAAIVLISPNFGPRDRRSEMMLWPWGAQILRAVQGDEVSWAPQNEGHATWWTTVYPSDALLPMMAAVEAARESPVERIDVPVFMAFSDTDQVVSPEQTRRFLARLSGELLVDTMMVRSAGDRHNHVIAGDILSPDRTEDVARRIVHFLRAALPAAASPTSFP